MNSDKVLEITFKRNFDKELCAHRRNERPFVFDALILYNYRLLMRSTHDHEDRVRYWLTDAEGGGQPIPDKVFMVMSRPKSKVYYCFIKLSGIFLHKD